MLRCASGHRKPARASPRNSDARNNMLYRNIIASTSRQWQPPKAISREDQSRSQHKQPKGDRAMNDATPLLSSAAELAKAFSGQVLVPADPGYDEARKVHNGLIDKRPALIARCHGTADVADAVSFARAHGLEIAVRGGGHNVAGRATIDGGLMIDLSPDEGHPRRSRRRARPARRAASPGTSSTARPSSTAWPPPAASSPPPASPASRSAAAWAGSWASTAWRSTICCRWTSSWLTAASSRASEDRTPGPVLGAARRRRQFRRGDLVRVPPAPGRPDRHRRPHRLPVRDGLGRAAPFPRRHRRRRPTNSRLGAGLVHAPDGSGRSWRRSWPAIAARSPTAKRPFARSSRSAGRRWTPSAPSPTPPEHDARRRLPRGALNYWKSSFMPELSDDAIRAMIDTFAHCPTPMGAAARAPPRRRHARACRHRLPAPLHRLQHARALGMDGPAARTGPHRLGARRLRRACALTPAPVAT